MTLQKDWTDDVIDTLDEMPELSNSRPIGLIDQSVRYNCMVDAEERMTNARHAYVKKRCFDLQNKMELAIVEHQRAKEAYENFK